MKGHLARKEKRLCFYLPKRKLQIWVSLLAEAVPFLGKGFVEYRISSTSSEN
jgi:hypothetical protein